MNKSTPIIGDVCVQGHSSGVLVRERLAFKSKIILGLLFCKLFVRVLINCAYIKQFNVNMNNFEKIGIENEK